jgi:glycosidase
MNILKKFFFEFLFFIYGITALFLLYQQRRILMIFYELFLRSFYDSNGDGIGDFKGLEEKLDYFKDLGVDTIWLLPIMKSPAFHGYTISDFYETNPAYGTLSDLKSALKKGHEMGLKFVLDLPINHVAVNSNWFQKALKKEKPYEDWFIWANEKTDLSEERHWGNDLIWHKIGDKYFYGLFGPGSPDLNFEHKSLWKEMKNVFKFWLDAGFDGFRLDAAKHIFDYDEKNMFFKYQHNKNINFWEEMLDYVYSIKEDAIIVSEIWDDQKIVEKYEGVFDIGFNFPLSGDMKDSIKKENTRKFVKALKNNFSKYIDKKEKVKTKSGNFLTNHDMQRLISEYDENEDKTKFAYSILYTLPGKPFIFYGEELGLRGELVSVNYTEDSQEPFHWYEIGFGPGQTEWKGYKFNPPYSQVSYEYQKDSKDSMFNFVKDLINFRKENNWIDDAGISIISQNESIVKIKINNDSQSIIVIYNFKSSKSLLNVNKNKIIKCYGLYTEKCDLIEINGFTTLILKE